MGRKEGSKTWHKATKAKNEKEQRKLAPSERGKHVFDNLSSKRQEAIIHQGRETVIFGVFWFIWLD